jgi:di/tricarboxylate transporter
MSATAEGGVMVAAPPTEALVVFALVAGAVALFVTEIVPADVTAISVVVALVALEPWTGVDGRTALSGFASPATVTILAMYVLSAGVQSTGAVRRLGARVAAFTRGDPTRLLGATIGITGPLAGFINNTPVVAMFIPMVTDLADDARVSPSKLLIPLSYASMLGGTLTLVGTATNVLASDLTDELIGETFSMFEFTPLGVLVLVVGLAYLMTVGRWLLPERVLPTDLTAEFGLGGYLHRVYVQPQSPLVGRSVEEAMGGLDVDVDIIQIVRGEETIIAPADRGIREQDVLTLRADEADLAAFVELGELRRLPSAAVTEAELDEPAGTGTLVGAVVPPGSRLSGETLRTAELRQRYTDTVLAFRRGEELFHEGLADFEMREGDGLLLYTTVETVESLRESGDLVVTDVVDHHRLFDESFPPFFETRAPLAIGIVAAVVASAALDLLPIAVAALGGLVAMVLTGVLDTDEAYAAVNWPVVFLLAGVIPLGLAIQSSGGAAYLGALVVGVAAFLPAVAVLALFYLLTGMLANVVTPVASVVLVLPVAVSTAGLIGADPFAFALGVTFGAATAFTTPIGYQTNLMVYSAGRYRFTDYVRVGLPLQLLLAVVTPIGIELLWGV